MEQTADQTSLIQNIEAEVTNVNLKAHTVILLIGPSGAGKTTFSNGYLIPSLKASSSGNKKINVQYIGSDAIRREILDDPDMDKMAKEMVYVSEQAFDILFNRLKNAVSYPVSSEFVIIDTTGLSKQFRDNVIKIARDHSYNVAAVLFDYKNRKDYYENIKDGSEDIRVTTRHIDTFKNTTTREIGKRDYDVIVKIKSRNFDKYNFVIDNYEEYNSHYLPFGPEYVIFGDIHGCYDEFVTLLGKHGFEISSDGIISHIQEGKTIVLVGDIIDKGYGIADVINLIYKNIDKIKMVLGNHENFVYKYLKGLIDEKTAPSEEVINEYFNTIYILQKDESLKQKFFDIVESCKGFFIHRDFIVTHAPCQTKYLGKLASYALKAQRDYKYPKYAEGLTEEQYVEIIHKEFEFIRNQAVRNHPYHIFGHIMTSKSNAYYNKVNIDTGCVAGNKLTSVVVNPNGRLFFVDAFSSENEKIKKESLVNFFPEKSKKEIEFSDLEPRDKGRMFHSAVNKVNFISGTVCPADKDLEKQDLESLEKGFEYYKSKGITKLVLQPKYMGSRANVYLFKDAEKNYTTTRNGYKIKHIDLTEAYKPLYDIPYIKERFDNNLDLIILDAELLPWSAIGKGLIQDSFFTIEEAVKSEISFLKEHGFEEAFMGLYNGPYKTSGYENASHKKSKSEMKELFGDNVERTYRSVKQFMRSYITIENTEKNLSVFSRQLELFGGEGEINFRPFSILKEVNVDDSEKLFFEETNEFVYKSVGLDEMIVIDLENPGDLIRAKEFYDKVTENMEMEGIMVKPEKIYNKGIAPCLKVRNPRYLTIVYGPDYTHSAKFEKLINKKSVGSKLKTSIKEFEIGKKMLEIPYSKIEESNIEYLKIVVEMIVEEKHEKLLDPRL